LALAEAMRPDLAFVDIHLADGPTGVEVARHLHESLGATVLFMTANARRIPEDRAGAKGVISKPYTECGVHQAIAHVTASGTVPSGDEVRDDVTFIPFAGQLDEDSHTRA
jgi:CheY-like chemotaxis protein